MEDTNMSYESVLESTVDQAIQSTPPNYVSERYKPKKEFDIETEFATFREEIKALITSHMDIKNSNNNIEAGISALSVQNEELKKKIEQLEQQAIKDKDYITVLEDKVEDLQRGSRKANLELKNVPRLPSESKEDLINMATSLSKSINCNLEARDIKDIYRVRNKTSDVKNCPIVVELVSTIMKSELLRSAKSFNIRHKEKLCAKHLGFKKEEYTPVYVSEQLTPKGARLHFLARDLAKSKEYKFCWTAYGKVYVRKSESSPIIPIKTEAQVHNLMQLK